LSSWTARALERSIMYRMFYIATFLAVTSTVFGLLVAFENLIGG
jgi:hypothetical protein